MSKTAIIGVGNKLMGDDGVGVHVVEYLRANEGLFATDIDILDAGTGGMNLLHIMEEYDHAIIIDAADFGGRPGEIRSFKVNDNIRLADDSAQISLHGTSLAGILELAKKLEKKMPKITIVAIQPKTIAPSLSLSNECRKAVTAIPQNIRPLLGQETAQG